VLAVASGGTLPFTGVSLVWVCLGALMLLLLGLGLMSAGRRQESDRA
jgi:hypothetical protein